MQSQYLNCLKKCLYHATDDNIMSWAECRDKACLLLERIPTDITVNKFLITVH